MGASGAKKAAESLDKKILEKRYKPTREDSQLSYTFEEVKESRIRIDELYKEFSDVMEEVLKKEP